jgi:hypothetical protein
LRCTYSTSFLEDLEIWKLLDNGTEKQLNGVIVTTHYTISSMLETSAERLFDDVGESNSIVAYCRRIPYYSNGTRRDRDSENYNFTRLVLRDATAADLDLTTGTGGFNVTIASVIDL